MNRRLLFVLLLLAWHAVSAQQPPVRVFAAASLTNVLQDIGLKYQQDTGRAVTFSFASSAALAKQIEAGAAADIFISADNDWMDYLQTRNRIQTASRRVLAGNRLVLIAPKDSSATITLRAPLKLLPYLGSGRLAIGDPASVPAGKYAQAALTKMQAWSDVVPRLVLGDSVRTALNFVSRGDAPLGIVYATDALIEPSVKVVGVFAEDTHERIVYPMALITNASAQGRDFMTYLTGAESRAFIRRHGFLDSGAESLK